MPLTRFPRLRAVISAFAGLAALVSLATSTPRPLTSRAERLVRDVAFVEYATPRPVVRQVAGETSRLVRLHERSAAPLAWAAPHAAFSMVRVERVHADPSAAIRGPIRARRLTFRYDATAPPNIL
jgi:hypothetical protein